MSRLPATERRSALLGTAGRIFCRGSYRGTTTAEIAREAGVTEPILYRHFESKRDLYLACVAEAWDGVRATWDAAIEKEPDSSLWLNAMGRAYMEVMEERLRVATLWVHALTEASDDAEIRKFMKRHMREVHAYVCDVIRRGQAAGGIDPARDPSAEAWIFIAIGLLTTVGRRLGGLVGCDMPMIIASRQEWMRGTSA